MSLQKSQASENEKSPIAKLPSGVSVAKTVNGAGRAFWRVRLGKRFTGGAVIKKDFAKLEDARDFWKQHKGQKQETGKIPLSHSEIAEAINAFKRLQGHSLSEAVDYYLRYALPAGGQKTFGDVADEFIKSRIAIGCKEKTMTQYVSYVQILKAEWGKEYIHQIKRADIEDWISELEKAPRTKKNYLVTLTTMFNFAMGREYCVDNPAEKAERPILDDVAPGILTPDEVRSLLQATIGCMPDLVPAISIGLFAGLRRSEICSLDWSEINLSGRFIEVKGSKAKTRKRRLVSISDNLALWLEPYSKSFGTVAPNVDSFGEKLKHLVRGRPQTQTDEGRPPVKDPWPHNAIRHSFGSYFYGKTKNENMTAAEMGNSPQMVFQHYRELVRPNEVMDYWEIKPSSSEITFFAAHKTC